MGQGGMPAAPDDPDESSGPLAVGLAVLAGAPPVEPFAAALQQESLRVWRVPVPGHATAAAEVPAAVLLWLPADMAEDRLEAMVAWRNRVARTVALLGCAPLGGTEDCERALAAGFDDFVAGRSAPREMARRIRAVVRRRGRADRPARSAGRHHRVRLDPGEHRLWVDGVRVPVTRTELAVMSALVEAGGQSRTRAEILVRAWGDDSLEIGERAVDNVIMRLRRKLPDPALIVTVRGVGFRLGG